jgi:hypothetical protein
MSIPVIPKNGESFEDLMKRVYNLKEPKKPKATKGKKLSKAEEKKYKEAAKKYNEQLAEIRKLEKETNEELSKNRAFTDFDSSHHPFEIPNDRMTPAQVKAMKTWVKTTYMESFVRQVYNLSDYQLAVVDKTGKVIMTSLYTEKVFNALFDIRNKEKEERKTQKEALDKAMQEQV